MQKRVIVSAKVEDTTLSIVRSLHSSGMSSRFILGWKSAGRGDMSSAESNVAIRALEGGEFICV